MLEDYGGTGNIRVANDDLICRPEASSVCRKSGCQTGPPARIWSEWKAASQTFRRCDSNGCDAYSAEIYESGIFTNISVASHGLMMRIAQDGSFMELATEGKVVYVHHGTCSKVAR